MCFDISGGVCYHLSKSTIDSLVGEIDKSIDVKLNGGEVSKESFNVTNGFYSNIFSKFEFKYFPSHTHEAILNIVKSFQAIGVELSENDSSKDELSYLKSIINDILNVKSSDIFRGIEIKTGRFYTSSQICSNCGHQYTNLTIKTRKWTCPTCKTKHQRDINVAKNILQEGIKLIS